MPDGRCLSAVPADRALQAWGSAREAGGCPGRLPAERVRLEDAAGRVTAEPVWATRSSPPFDAAGMDGIAVRAADTLGASETSPVYLEPDAYDVVDTGDPMPGGRDAVVMREHVHHAGEAAEVRAAVPPYQHVRSIGEDVSMAELLLPQGHRLRAVDLAAAAAAGATQLLVRRSPVVAVLPTGDEVRPIGTQTGPGEILDTNSLMLAAQAREAGAVAHCLPIVPDDPARLAGAVSAAVASCDLLIIVAGSSAGRDDYTARIVAQLGTLALHGAAVRPCHPAGLRVLGRTPVLGAPGSPRSPPPPADPGRAGPQARLPARHGRLGAGAPGSGGGHDGRHAAAPRRWRAHLAGPRRRAARRPGRAGRSPSRRGGRDRAAPQPGRDLPYDRRHRLP